MEKSEPSESYIIVEQSQLLVSFSLYKLRLQCPIQTEIDRNTKFYIYKLFQDGFKGIEVVNQNIQGSQGFFDIPQNYKSIFSVAMYNQDKQSVQNTFKSILLNQQKMYLRNLDNQKNLMIVILDGYKQILHDQKLIEFLYQLRLFDRKLMQTYQVVDQQEQENDYIYAFQSKIMLQRHESQNQKKQNKYSNLSIALGHWGKGIDVIFAIKPLNMKKLHSHLWLFYGFCIYLEPELVFMIDMGTQPFSMSLIQMISYMQKFPETSGACGQIKVSGIEKCDILLRAQWFEFKLAHCLVKTFQHICGYIPVLPGAFSVYRWSAFTLNNYEVLRAYLKPFRDPLNLTWSDQNIYHLAQDRVISEKLVKLTESSVEFKCCPKGHYLSFVKEAKAYTEGQNRLSDLMWQRKRWNNGAWFALINISLSYKSICEILQSSHNLFCKFLMFIQILYYSLVIIFQWVAVGAYYLAYSMTIRVNFIQKYLDLFGFEEEEPIYIAVFDICRFSYVFCIFAVFCLSLSMNPRQVPDRIWNFFSFYFSFTVVIMILGVIIFLSLGEFQSQIAQFGILIVPIAILLSILIYGQQIDKIIQNFIPYVLMIPIYINILMVFSISRTDDITWGTRHITGLEVGTQTVQYQLKKFLSLFFFVICNLFFGLLFQEFDKTNFEVMEFLYSICLLILITPLIGEFLYMMKFCGRKCMERNVPVREDNL